MPVPQAVKDWLRRTYPRPTVNPEWLEACCDWITSELHVPPTQTDELIRHVDAQLLQSDLADSMLPGTGFAPADGRTGAPVLCQLAALSDIGHSAFALHTTRQNRIDKADMTGLALAQGDEEAAEDEGPIPRYPRGMLRFQLSDGSLAFNAIEYRKIPQLVLGETPLGYKFIVRNALVKRGYIFLEPACVTLKGYACDDLDANRDRDFARGLRLRLGQPEDEEEGAPEDRPPSPPAPAPAPAQPAARVPPQRQPSPAPRRHRTDDDEFEDTAFSDLDDATLAQLDTLDAPRAPPPAPAPPKSEEAEEFEFDDDSMSIDEDMLAMVDKLENEHTQVAPPSEDTMVSTSSGARRGSVIEIDSGDDEDDKAERVSVPPPPLPSSQRSRPPTQRRPPVDDDVIEISD